MKATKRNKIFIFAALVIVTMTGLLRLSGQTPTPTPQIDPAKTTAIDRVRSEGSALLSDGSPTALRNAIERFRDAARLAHDAGLKYHEALFLKIVGETYSKLDLPEKAFEFFVQSAGVGQTDDKKLTADTLNQIALIYNDHGNHGDALKIFALESDLRDEIGDIPGQIAALHNAAMIFNELGDMQRAKGVYESILEVERETNSSPQLLASSTNNLAYVYYRLENYPKAAELYGEANKIAVKGGYEDIQAATLIGLGDSYHKLNDQPKAIDHYNRGLALAQKTRRPIFEADALYGLGNVYRSQGDKRRALEFYDRALALQNAAGAREQLSNTLYAEMLVLRDLGLPQLAVLYGKSAVNLSQGMRQMITGLSRDTQRLYLKSKEQTYRDLSDILISEGRLPEAQAVLDLLKEQEFGQFAMLRSGESPDTVPYSGAESNVIAKIEGLAALGRRQSELEKLRTDNGALTADEQAEFTKIMADLETANKAFRLALDSLSKAETSVEAKISEIQSEKNLQRTLGRMRSDLNTGVAAIYTVIGTESDKSGAAQGGTHAKFGWAILVTPEGRKAYPIDVTNLEETVQQFRTALSSARYDPRPLAQKLYDAIFRQTSKQQKTTLEADLAVTMAKYKDRTIMWSLDGTLRYVPMAALHDGKNYLVEKYRNTVFTKQSLLLLNEKDAAKWQTLGLGVSEEKTIDNRRFAALEGTKRELQDIIHQGNEKTGILDGTRVLNGDFTRENTLRLWREGKYQAIHIASHFSFDPIDQNASFLVIGDGKLTFADIQDKDNLFGSVDLLTLSACDTAMSSNGKEQEGFPYLAQSLGAKTVIASLWKVSDAGTPELMIRFYKLRAANPQMSKGEAFRRAQMSLLSGEANAGTETDASKSAAVVERSDPIDLDGSQMQLPLYVKDPAKPFAHPHYWASFVLIGNWR